VGSRLALRFQKASVFPHTGLPEERRLLDEVLHEIVQAGHYYCPTCYWSQHPSLEAIRAGELSSLASSTRVDVRDSGLPPGHFYAMTHPPITSLSNGILLIVELLYNTLIQTGPQRINSSRFLRYGGCGYRIILARTSGVVMLSQSFSASSTSSTFKSR